MHSYDVTIVGGGVIGCAIARELSRYRLRVLLLERAAEVGFGTSKANSGIIHAGHHSDPSTLKGRLEWEGNRRWPDLAAALGFGFRRIGELTVAFDEDDRHTLRALLDRGERKGVTGLELWPPDGVHAEEPNLSREIVEALHAPTAAVVNPYEVCFALAENAVRNGVSLACGIFAYATHVRRDAPRLTAWDVAGVFMIIGCAAAMFSDPDQLFQTVGQIAME